MRFSPQIFSSYLFSLGLALLTGCLLVACKEPDKRILVFTKTTGYRHASIEDGVKAITELGAKKKVFVDTTSDGNKFNDDNLSRYDAVVFLSTTGTVLSHYQKASFERYIQSGGGFAGVHAAADCEYFWPWYGKLVGAYFESHPEIQDAQMTVVDKNHPSTAALPKQWRHRDEWYNFRPESLNKDVNQLIILNENSYKGGKNGKDHPIAWYHEYDGGRAWYTGLGHTAESYKEAEFLAHLWGGIEYAMGNGKPNYAKATTQLPPDDNRFSKKVFADNLDEPTELAVTNEGDVFFVQRKGEIFYHINATKQSVQIAKLDVWTRNEDGLLGITLDPNYARNHWVYLFYSPNIPEAIQRISRFTYDGTTLVNEKVLLTVPVQREECCHSAGSLTFGPNGNLYIALGDNTNPFASDGYSPSDEQPERTAWDAQRSAGNTFDLRGKILRIHPEPSGTYTIPEGNLFPVTNHKGRPEIFVMGCRNPYRISVDMKDGTLYWGDVGPDAGKDSIQGPMGHDEMNFARTPGYYGWPYFIGNNIPYADYDFVTKVAGPKHNPLAPQNHSPSNTGMVNLPPARPALVYYPYAASDKFPQMQKGGRSAMAGPVYHFDNNLASTVKLPKYYDGCTIMYEWMRNLFFAMKVDQKGQITRMDPMFTSLPLNRVIDMELAPDGSIWLLEYGSLWFSKNIDARLVKIEYSTDNRLPVAKAEADVTIGKLPLTVKFSSKGTFDYDAHDTLSYEWRIETPYKADARVANPTHTFTKPGIYNVVLIVTDSKGNSSTAGLTVRAGNAEPVVNITSTDNMSFFTEGQKFSYRVQVTDLEDEKGTGVDPSRIVTTLAYVPVGKDMTVVAQGHQANKNAVLAKSPAETLIEGSDCKACHNPEVKSVGPSYRMIAERYANEKGAMGKLARKVITGGAGNWGDHGMSAHPQLSLDDAKEMVAFILDYGKPAKPANAIPPIGTVTLNLAGKQAKEDGVYVMTSTYQDKGAPGIGSLVTEAQLVLRSPRLQGEAYDDKKGGTLRQTTADDSVPTRMQYKGNGEWLMYRKLDLTNFRSFTVRTAAERDLSVLEVRIDSATGPVIGEVTLPNTKKWSIFETATANLKPVTGRHDLYFVLRLDDDPNNQNKKMLGALDWVLLKK